MPSIVVKLVVIEAHWETESCLLNWIRSIKSELLWKRPVKQAGLLQPSNLVDSYVTWSYLLQIDRSRICYMEYIFLLSLAWIYRQRYATSNEYRAKQNNSSNERQREQQKLPNRQPNCSNSAKWSQQVAKRRRIFRKHLQQSKGARKGRRNSMLNSNRYATGAGMVWAEEARARNANEGTGNQASTTGGGAWARAQNEENRIREWWCSFPIN